MHNAVIDYFFVFSCHMNREYTQQVDYHKSNYCYVPRAPIGEMVRITVQVLKYLEIEYLGLTSNNVLHKLRKV